MNNISGNHQPDDMAALEKATIVFGICGCLTAMAITAVVWDTFGRRGGWMLLVALPVIAALTSGAVANALARRQTSVELNFWVGVGAMVIAFLLTATIWAVLFVLMSDQALHLGMLVLWSILAQVWGLTLFGWFAALAGGVAGWLCKRCFFNTPSTA